MPRRVRGVLAVEGTQTGDGRFIVSGAAEWPDPPLPLALQLTNEGGHTGAVQVGTIDSVSRGSGGSIDFVGTIDDGQPDGAEAVRRMTEGTGPMGARFGVSIDADDFEVELVDTSGGSMVEPAPVAAAAGDGDPVGEVVATDATDTMVERYTRLRIRGATLLSIGAVSEAYVELDDSAAEPAPVVEGETVASAAASGCACESWAHFKDMGEVITASAPIAPPGEWFDNPGLSAPTPLTVTADGRVFGHLAQWSTCHTGIADRCVMAPRSAAAYAYFTTGAIVTADGTQRRVGQLTMGTGHAPLSFDHRAAAAHYDGGAGALAWADVAVGEDAHGVWVAGAIRPGLSDEQVREARALALSGDWRSIGGSLELVAALSVPVPGFPVLAVAASASPTTARARVDHGTTMALVAAGVVVPAPPWQTALDEVRAELGLLRRNLELLAPLAAEQIVAAMRAEAEGNTSI
jgi:hypothetical protein